MSNEVRYIQCHRCETWQPVTEAALESRPGDGVWFKERYWWWTCSCGWEALVVNVQNSWYDFLSKEPSEGKAMIVCVTQSYDTLGNIDMYVFDLSKLVEDHPYRLAVELAIKNGFKVGRLNNEAVFEGPLADALTAAEVRLPATVSDHVHLRVAD